MRYPKLSFDKFSDVLSEWDNTRNKYNFSYYSERSGYNAHWVCSLSHRWKALISNRIIHGTGCPYCSGNKPTTENNLLIKFPLIAEEFDSEKNHPIKPIDVLPFSHFVVWFKCKNNHSWKARVGARTRMGNGCPYCSGLVPSGDRLISSFPDLLARFSPLNKLPPDKISIGSSKKVIWLCNNENCVSTRKTTTPNFIRSGMRCQMCSPSSIYELRVEKYLVSKNVVFEKQFRFKGSDIDKLKFDFIVNFDNNFCLIECNGAQHYKMVPFCSNKKKNLLAFYKVLVRDQRKRDFCRKNGFNLINLPFYEINDCENILNIKLSQMQFGLTEKCN